MQKLNKRNWSYWLAHTSLDYHIFVKLIVCGPEKFKCMRNCPIDRIMFNNCLEKTKEMKRMITLYESEHHIQNSTPYYLINWLISKNKILDDNSKFDIPTEIIEWHGNNKYDYDYNNISELKYVVESIEYKYFNYENNDTYEELKINRNLIAYSLRKDGHSKKFIYKLLYKYIKNIPYKSTDDSINRTVDRWGQEAREFLEIS